MISFVEHTHPSGSLKLALTTLPDQQQIFVCCRGPFCAEAVSTGNKTTLVWWSMACSGGSEIGNPSQAWMPSAHVCSNCVSPSFPHFLNQAPPRVQQLRFPDAVATPHLLHVILRVLIEDKLVVVAFSVAKCRREHTWKACESQVHTQ